MRWANTMFVVIRQDSNWLEMSTTKYIHQTHLNASPERVYRWHEEPSALQRLTPEDDAIDVVKAAELVDGKRVFYGMSSQTALDTHGARKDGYRGTEGKTIVMPDRGPVKDTVEQILGGVRSTCTYIGATRIKDMPKCAHFVRVNNVINHVYDKYEK